MNTLVLAAIAFVGYIIAYKTYGNYIAKKIFNLNSANKVPSQEYADGVDYVPTKKSVLFGHHFTTIAGLGPIVGPAIGIIWGWLPAFIWVFVGAILMGAVHDFATLVISARAKGQTIGELTGGLVGDSARYAFQFIIQFLLFIVLAVFAMIVGVLFKSYPEAVIPVWLQIPIALWLGRMLRRGKNELLYSIVAVMLMYGTIMLGIRFPIHVFPINGSEVVTWSIILFVYVYIASTLPVNILLQPRDYINSHQLLVAIVLLIAGLIIAHPPVYAPAINPAAERSLADIPAMIPLLFITIACGSISGFHSLASSGTTVKQLRNEQDAKFIGFGSMLWESFLAVIVLMAVAGGLGLGVEHDGEMITGAEAFKHHYSSWAAASGLDAKLGAFITGGANLFASYGIPLTFGKSMIAVFIVSFANTTLDSAARIQRLSLQELVRNKDGKTIKPFQNRYFTTFVVIFAASMLTFTKGDASGALVLWPLFGALNQLLAALGLGIVTIWLVIHNKNFWISFFPMVFVLIATFWAMILNLIRFIEKGDVLLSLLSAIIIVLSAIMLFTGLDALIRSGRRQAYA
jgi:carbon starvation protein